MNTTRRPTGESRTFEPQRVLLVDDDPPILELTAAYLKHELPHLKVTTVPSAAAALSHLDETRPDAIVSDYDMPGCDGLEFLDIIREEYGEIPFILFTNASRADLPTAVESWSRTSYQRKSAGSTQFEILAERVVRAIGVSGSNG
jgi:CheY-like chemotaxis protein